MALNAPYLPPNPLRPRAFGGKGAEGMRKGIPSSKTVVSGRASAIHGAGLVILALAQADALAQREGTDTWADPPYVTTSQRMEMGERPNIADLPVMGTIEWTHESLPFIDDGPRGGISGAAFEHHDGALYLAGGFIPLGDGTDDPSYRTSQWAYRYDLENKTWEQLPDMPGRVEYTRGIVHGDAFYVAAGGTQRKTAAGHFAPSADVFQLSGLAGNPTWSKHSQLDVARTHPAAGAVGDYMIVVGGNEYVIDGEIMGLHSTTVRDTTEVFDMAHPEAGWQTKAPIPVGPRGWAASATVGNEFYLFAGLDVVTREHDGAQIRMKYQDALSYNPAMDQWTQHTDVPFAITGWEAATYQDRYVILIGGVQAEVLSPEQMGQNTWNDMAFLYDTVDDRWMRLDGLLPVGGVYNDAGVVIVGDTIYVLGGEGPKGSHFDTLAIGQITLIPEPAGAAALGAFLPFLLARHRPNSDDGAAPVTRSLLAE